MTDHMTETAKNISKKTQIKATKSNAKTAKSDKIAVIRTGGKQYVVSERDTIKIEKLPAKSEGASLTKDGKVTFEDVLLVSDGDRVSIGTPTIKTAKVTAQIVAEGRYKKVRVVHYRAKSRHFVRAGHRQPFVQVEIDKIGN